tara:strand:+ start:121 stop:462 length:342 start_codon:yes stop_codon:yes gene_type:complete
MVRLEGLRKLYQEMCEHNNVEPVSNEILSNSLMLLLLQTTAILRQGNNPDGIFISLGETEQVATFIKHNDYDAIIFFKDIDHYDNMIKHVDDVCDDCKDKELNDDEDITDQFK